MTGTTDNPGSGSHSGPTSANVDAVDAPNSKLKRLEDPIERKKRRLEERLAKKRARSKPPSDDLADVPVPDDETGPAAPADGAAVAVAVPDDEIGPAAVAAPDEGAGPAAPDDDEELGDLALPDDDSDDEIGPARAPDSDAGAGGLQVPDSDAGGVAGDDDSSLGDLAAPGDAGAAGPGLLDSSPERASDAPAAALDPGGDDDVPAALDALGDSAPLLEMSEFLPEDEAHEPAGAALVDDDQLTFPSDLGDVELETGVPASEVTSLDPGSRGVVVMDADSESGAASADFVPESAVESAVSSDLEEADSVGDIDLEALEAAAEEDDDAGGDDDEAGPAAAGPSGRFPSPKPHWLPVSCLGCGFEATVPRHFGGKQVRCKECGALTIVPGEEEEEEEGAPAVGSVKRAPQRAAKGPPPEDQTARMVVIALCVLATGILGGAIYIVFS